MKYGTALILLLSILSCSENEPLRTGLEGKLLPNFSVLLNDSSTFVSTTSVKNDRPIVLLYFSPDCPHCEAQIKDIVNNISSLKSIDFYFITSRTITELKEVSNKYNLSKYKNITIGKDTGYMVARYFGAYNVPYVAIYDGQKKLKHAYLGKLDTDQIKREAKPN